MLHPEAQYFPAAVGHRGDPTAAGATDAQIGRVDVGDSEDEVLWRAFLR